MIYINNIEKLKKSMQINPEKPKSGKHLINHIQFLPFGTRETERAKFNRKFAGVTGELFRIINEQEISNEFKIEESINDITSIVKCNTEEDKKYLNELIKENLIDKDGDLKLFHPNIFKYIQVTEGNESSSEKNIAVFIYDAIFNNEKLLLEALDEDEVNNVITKLILSKLQGLKEKKVEKIYKNNLQFISDLAKEDFMFISKHKEFFLKNFQSLLAYYYFFYITQLSVKLNKKLNGNYENVEELYYLLDWEKASKNRRSEIKGYKYIKCESKYLFINVNILEHLNVLLGEKNKNFAEIKILYNDMNDEEKSNYLDTIEAWIIFYRNHFEQSPIKLDKTLEGLISALHISLLERIKIETMTRYALYIEAIGKKYFLKTRGGTYGYMLNITQEMILVLTAVSIKTDKITLKSLFKEYEKRGLFLDQQSQELVSDLLTKLNLIDKKSDSGDAQYVKSIL